MTKRTVEENDSDEKIITFYKETIKQTFLVWLKVEPNNTKETLKLIDEFLTNGKLKSLETFDNVIYEEAAKRLYKDGQIPLEIKKLTKCKLPRIIELLSNAPKHIIDQMIDSHNKKKDNETIVEYGKQKIIEYLIVNELLDMQPMNLTKPNLENLKEILEYQQIFEMKVEIIVKDKFEEIKKKAESEIKTLFILNENKKDNFEFPDYLSKIITNVRGKIPSKSKEQWLFIETAIEITLNIIKQDKIKVKVKPKVGRPKKRQEEEEQARSANFMEKFVNFRAKNELDIE